MKKHRENWTFGENCHVILRIILARKTLVFEMQRRLGSKNNYLLGSPHVMAMQNTSLRKRPVFTLNPMLHVALFTIPQKRQGKQMVYRKRIPATCAGTIHL